MEYYEGMAALKLGKNDKAQGLFSNVIAKGKRMLVDDAANGFFAKFGWGLSRNAV